MAKPSEHGYVLYPPTASGRWSRCLRVQESGTRRIVARLFRKGDDLPKNAELLEIEHVAPGVLEVKAVYGRPAMVNSRSFREGWERIFSGRPTEMAQA